MTRSPRTARRVLAVLALAALPALAACNVSQLDPAGALPELSGTDTVTAAPTTVYVRTAAPAPDVPAVPVTKPPAHRAPAHRAAVTPAPTTTPRTSSTPRSQRRPAAPTSTRPTTTPRPTPAPVLGDPAPCDAAAGTWNDTTCTARQGDAERIGRQEDGPDGSVCTVVAVDPDRMECTPPMP